ncbi:nuclear transport factor 2 family protein [Mumia quercus]|uniref:nuclear transport factor 2 family protein n=1 Tax=Mumia quercus TaxID=2976125 RepID=UPI0021D013CE|nr:nuclear transport factor 2 family protein [Mumia quercus]
MRMPVPPFTPHTARTKVQRAEDAWNTKDPDLVAQAYSPDSRWRNRDTFLEGRQAIREFLARKWQTELDYALRKELWAFTGHRIAVRFAYEWRDASGQFWRSYGNENWLFDDGGYMTERHASINDVAIAQAQRRILGPRPRGEETPTPW